MQTLRRLVTQTTNLPNGVTNAAPYSTMQHSPELDATRTLEYFDDFNNPADMIISSPQTWTVTKGGTSTITQATGTTYGTGGRILLTTGTSSGNSIAVQANSDGFVFDSTSFMFMKVKLQTDQISTSNIIFGLQEINTTPKSATDGIWFSKASGAANWVIKIVKSSTATTSATIATMVANTDIVLGLEYDPNKVNDSGSTGAIIPYLNDVRVPLAIPVTNAPTTTLAPVFYCDTQSAAAIHVAFDYADILQVRQANTPY